MAAVVIDTNVPVVANGQHEKAGLQCQSACIQSLNEARNKIVLVDDNQRIFTAYRKHLSHRGQPGLGDAFFKWLWDNQANPQHCLRVQITPVGSTGTDFEEYPADPDLARFDPDDRVFVAVARASGLAPEILNASDTDWWPVRDAFSRHSVHIRFLCEELMTRKA